MGNPLPITSKLWPRASNLLYLAEVAVLTRLATGVARVLENRPSRQKDPNVTEGQKKQAMTERFFVEIFGTMGYMICLHLGQDVVDKISNRFDRSRNLLRDIEQGVFSANEGFGQAAKELGVDVRVLESRLRDSVKNTYGDTGHNLIARSLYGEEDAKGAVTKANMVTVKNKLKASLEKPVQEKTMDEAFKKIVNEVKPLKKLAQRSNYLAIAGILTGVATSAVVGGTVTQWLNDRMVAPTAKKFFARKKGMEPMMGQAKPAEGQLPAPKPLSLLSQAPAMPMPLNPAAPVYLPNPKMQPSSAHFASLALRPTGTVSPFSGMGGLL